jgi:hypothetical protein
MVHRDRQRRERRGGGGLLLAAALAVLGAGAMPVVLCHAPGGHLAVELAGRGCLPATAAGEDAPDGGGCDACGVVAAEGCSDSPVLLSAVLMGGGARVLPGEAPVLGAPVAASAVVVPGWAGARRGPDRFSQARSCVLRS